MKRLLNFLENGLLWLLDKQIILLRPHFFLSEDEIVKHLIRHLSALDKQTIKEMPEPHLIFASTNITDAIEIYYWLWDKRNPYTNVEDGNINHPHNVSLRVLASVRENLRGEPNDKTT